MQHVVGRKITHAIVRQPGKSLLNAITSSKTPVRIDYSKAIAQHDNYCKALETCGVNVTKLPMTNDFPDSCFVEDVAICTPKMAVMTLPGDIRRKGEVKNIKEPLLQKYNNDNVLQIENGTLDGGDVMEVNGHYYIGLSKRTDEDGANQLIEYLNEYGYTGSTIKLQNEFLHLKSSVTYLENNLLITTPEFESGEYFKGMNKIVIKNKKDYGAANCVWVNGTILMPQGCLDIEEELMNNGYDKIYPIDTSEYNKVDGALTCLSLRLTCD